MRILLLPLILSLVQSLLQAQAPDTRLAEAAQRNDLAALKTLLHQRAPVNQAQGDGMTALHWAAEHDNLEALQLLTAAGADVRWARIATPAATVVNSFAITVGGRDQLDEPTRRKIEEAVLAAAR